MSALTAVVQIGTAPPLGGGVEPAVVAHLYEGGIPRFLAYEVTSGADGDPAASTGSDGPHLSRIPGAYAPPIEDDTAYPLTDLLLGTYREGSAITQRLDTLSQKAQANYGRTFREMVFASDVEWGSDGYGRLFEARSQLEAHPVEAVVAVGFLPGVSDEVRLAIEENRDRLDGATPRLTAGPENR
ncbi:hypothetical protein [Halorientalis pallida]|uniref:Uncharacterized protein n=1 Tax=Halorientalis pallida TaxID=2479928 RepID=A0A498KV52_9EURY|nr:hypothetical protein [Halorientalis pallida]RXK49057.1 hypothetical protein EAF64_09000 [Halorientalis pallida]